MAAYADADLLAVGQHCANPDCRWGSGRSELWPARAGGRGSWWVATAAAACRVLPPSCLDLAHPHRQLDFLPFPCSGCGKVYCLEHRVCPECSEAGKESVVVCPLCARAVICVPGEDVELAFDRCVPAVLAREGSAGRVRADLRAACAGGGQPAPALWMLPRACAHACPYRNPHQAHAQRVRPLQLRQGAQEAALPRSQLQGEAVS